MAFTISHGVMGTDAFQTYLTAESIVVDNDFDISNQKHDWPAQYSSPLFLGADGRVGGKYCRQELGLALYLVPFYTIGRFVAIPLHEPMRSYGIMFVTTMLAMPLASVFTIFLIYSTVKRLTNPQLGLAAVVLFWFASPFSVYAREAMSESLLVLLISLYFFAKIDMLGSKYAGLISALAIGLLPLVKFAYLPLSAVLLAVDYFPGIWKKTPGIAKQILGYAIPLIVVVAIDLAFNWIRFHQLRPAYSLNENPLAYYVLNPYGFLRGIAGLWLSPTKAIIIYAPIALIGLAAIIKLPSAYSPLKIRAAIVCALITLIHAPLTFWHGDGAWGTRYLMPCLPALIICAMVWIDQLSSVLFARRILLAAAVLGIVVQFPAWFTKPSIACRIHEDVEIQNELNYFSFNPRVQPVVIEWAAFISSLSAQTGNGSLNWNYNHHSVSLHGLDESNAWLSYGIRSGTVPPGSVRYFISVIFSMLMLIIASTIVIILAHSERSNRKEALILNPKHDRGSHFREELNEKARN